MTAGLIGLLMLLAAPDDVRSGPWPPNGYPCARATSEIVVDGRLDDAAWTRAPWTADFTDIEGDRRPAPRHRTRARMLWDDEYFYVAAELEEPHLWATLRERDSIIFYDNDFEIFLDPDIDSHLYTEIELNALNTVWDLLLIKPYRDGGPAIHAWDIPGLRTAVHLDGTLNDPSDIDRGWSVEIAIPFAVLAETTEAACPPVVGARWRVNFSRVQWRLDVVEGEYRKSENPATDKPWPEDNWVWSPQREIAMHEPEHWGVVEFTDGAADAEVGPTAVDAGAWYLRYASYRLAKAHEEEGRYPESITFTSTPEGGPPLDESWHWPPAYRGDGHRYLLILKSDTGELRLDENGRLHTLERD